MCAGRVAADQAIPRGHLPRPAPVEAHPGVAGVHPRHEASRRHCRRRPDQSLLIASQVRRNSFSGVLFDGGGGGLFGCFVLVGIFVDRISNILYINYNIF